MGEKKQKKLISLKEAAEVSGYSSDYIGQLIRAGKISGKQVYSNIIWMTTKKAILDYKNKNKQGNNKDKGIKNYWQKKKRQILLEFNAFKIIFKNFKSTGIILIILLLSIIFLSFYIFYYIIHPTLIQQTNKNKQQNKQTLSF